MKGYINALLALLVILSEVEGRPCIYPSQLNEVTPNLTGVPDAKISLQGSSKIK